MSIAKPSSANLIDIVGAGYRALSRRLWVLSIPIGLSATLWSSPALILGMPEQWRATTGQALEHALVELGFDAGLLERLLNSDLRSTLAWLNLVPVLTPPLAPPAEALTITNPLQFAGVLLLINIVTVFCSSLFLNLLGEAVTDERPPALLRLGRTITLTADLFVCGLLASAGLGLILPLLALATLVLLQFHTFGMLLLLSAYIALFWAYVYLSFAPEAILISRAGPIGALLRSFRFVRQNQGLTVGLLLLSTLISGGLGLLWHQVAATPLGLVIALVGSAYIGSGLSAARLEFYRTHS